MMRTHTAHSTLRWRPTVSYHQLTLPRFAASIKLRTDFGPPTPSGRPEGTGVYVVEPKGREGTFSRFVAVAKKEAPYIIASAVFVGVYSASTLAIPHGFGQLIDYASRGEMPWSLSWQLLSWFLAAGATNFIRLSLVGHAGERVVADLRDRVYRATINQPAAFYDDPENRTGALVQRISMDTNVVGSSLTEALSTGIKNVFQMVGSLGVMLYFSPKLTAAIVMVLPPVAIFAGTYGRFVRRLQQQKNDAQAKQATLAEERLSNIRTVKVFGHEAQEASVFRKRVDRVAAIGRRMVFYNSSYIAFLHVSGYLTLYVIVWAGSMLVASNDLTPGALFSFMLYTIYCGLGIMGTTNMVAELNKGYGASIRMFDVIDKAEQQRAAELANPGETPKGSQGKFEFTNVGFAYPTRPDVTVFKDLSFAIEPGKCTCVVGSSGTGKSSIALLLLRLYAATNGAVSYDGIDVNNINRGWLQSVVGLVPQEPVLFGGTIAQNIAYGVQGRDWDAPIDTWTMTSVMEAAKAANAHDFIMALPQQYETYVGEGGRSLSGGQKQRIAIARALIKKPLLLILDEATSALDSESEAVVQEAIEALIQETRSLRGQKAVLLFAHRLSMIRNADHILVLHEGKVIDEGDFETVKRNAVFCQLVGLPPPQAANDASDKAPPAASAAAAAEASN